MRIRLGGLTFLGDAGDARFTVERDALKGWIGKGGVGVRKNDSPRPLGHGSQKQRAYRTGRLVTWSGEIWTTSPAEQDHALAQLSGVLAEGEFGRMTVDSAFGTHWCDVQLDEEPDAKRELYGRLATYSIGVWCPDPEVFGETQTFSPGPVYHYGNFRAVADAVVTGPQSAPYTLAVAGRQFTVTQALTAGQVHTIDTANARVRRNGVLQSGVFSKAQSLIVAPGAPSTFTGPASAQLKVKNTLV